MSKPLPQLPLLGAVVVAALVLLVGLTPLRTIAANFLAIFEPREIVAIPLSRADIERLRALPDLGSFGTIRRGPRALHAVAASANAASQLARIPVSVPLALPNGAGLPRYRVIGETEASFTFSAAKARAAAAATGKPLPAMPPGLAGSTLDATIGPIVVAAYGTATSASRIRRGMRMPSLIVVEAAAPRVGSTGASAREIQAYLLSLPGISPQLQSEIAAIGDASSTLPIPVPIDKAYASTVAVQGVRGLAMGDNTGLGAGVLWERSGMIHAVAGSLPLADILTVANSMQECPAAGIRCATGIRAPWGQTFGRRHVR